MSPLNVGSGTVWCAHGEFPVPAPATARLLTGVPIYAGAVAKELVTPTGALLMTVVRVALRPAAAMRVEQIGYGAGAKDFKRHPNVLRVLVGETDAPAASRADRRARVRDRRHEPAAVRPADGPALRRRRAGCVLRASADEEEPAGHAGHRRSPRRIGARRLPSVLFTDSTTIGVRYQEMLRERLDREMRDGRDTGGTIRFKVASRDGRCQRRSRSSRTARRRRRARAVDQGRAGPRAQGVARRAEPQLRFVESHRCPASI